MRRNPGGAGAVAVLSANCSLREVSFMNTITTVPIRINAQSIVQMQGEIRRQKNCVIVR